MATKMSIVLALVALLAATIPTSIAQTTHVVGNSLGWVIPPSAATYTTWANTQTFAVGDTLVFNFATGMHSVAEVTRSAYDACTTANPISMSGTGPASITLTTAGEHFFLCTFAGHCDAGQKLSISVSAATPSTPAPVPQPIPAPAPPVQAPTPSPVSVPTPAPAVPVSSPSPVPATSPAPSPAGRTYIVGDSLGWRVPSDIVTYQNWAAGKNFVVGDILVFNFVTGQHTVTTVPTKAGYDNCSAAGGSNISTSPARITLTTPGQKFYICAFSSHCPAGQKLSINVSATGSPVPAPAPSTTTLPPSSTDAPPPSDDTIPPPPPSSARSFAGAALPMSLLAVALAFFF